jgi:hypothetical protein
MVTFMDYKFEPTERVYGIVIGLIMVVIGLFIFFYLEMWWGLVVILLGIIPLASGLIGCCPTIPTMGLEY